MHFHSPTVRSSSNNSIYIDFILSFKFEKSAQKLILSNPSPVVPMPAYIYDPNNPNRRPYNPYYHGEEKVPIQPTPSEEAEVTPTSNITPPTDSSTDDQPLQ
jgi:hypothetical protein